LTLLLTVTAIAAATDADGDGFDLAAGDCNDADRNVHPGAVEQCSGVDEDCSGIADDDGACPSCATETDGERQYLLCEDELAWMDARAECSAVGYELVSIGSEDEDDFVDLYAGLLLLDEWWLGLNDRATEGTFVWASGEPVTYTDWLLLQPDDGAIFGEDCVEMNVSVLAQWNDADCANHKGYICELPCTATWFLDGDGDGYGGSTSLVSCIPPEDYVVAGGDCNDGAADVCPSATESLNNVDDDCDGAIDEDDFDGDGLDGDGEAAAGTDPGDADTDDDGYDDGLEVDVFGSDPLDPADPPTDPGPGDTGDTGGGTPGDTDGAADTGSPDPDPGAGGAGGPDDAVAWYGGPALCGCAATGSPIATGLLGALVALLTSARRMRARRDDVRGGR